MSFAVINWSCPCNFPAAEDPERFNHGGVCSVRSTSHHATWPFTQETAGVYFARAQPTLPQTGLHVP